MRAFVICLVALALVPASAGAAGWVTGPPLSPPDRVSLFPQTAISPAGEQIVAWQQQQPNDPNNAEGIGVRTAAPGDVFGPEQLLPSNDAEDLSLTVGSDGTAALVWIGFGAHTELHVARRAPGQAAFTDSTPLDFGALVGAGTSPAVSVRDGTIYVAYQTSFSTAGSVFHTEIRAARLVPGSTTIETLAGSAGNGAIAAASWSEANNNFLEDNVETPDIEVARGAVTVSWEELVDANPSGHTNVSQTSRPLSAATFPSGTTVDTVPDPNFFRAEQMSTQLVARGDQLFLVWLRAPQQQLAFSSLLPGSTPQTVPNAAVSVLAALDPAGSILTSSRVFSTQIFASTVVAQIINPAAPAAAPPGVTLSSPTSITAPNALSVAPDGASLLVFDEAAEGSTQDQFSDVEASFRAAGGGFGPAEDISGIRDRTGVGTFDVASGSVGSDGAAIAAWPATDPTIPAENGRIFVSQRDATPPALGPLTVPATARPGTTVAMAAAASDSQSGVTVDWDFGDGSSGTGATVSHAYGAAGTYTVTARATDGVGNVAAQTATIVVGVPSATTPPDTTPPIVGSLKTANKKFRVGTSATATIAKAKRKARKSPLGTTFTLTLSERSTLVVTVGAKSHATRGGTLIRTKRGPGKVSIPFSGRVGSAKLAPGSYTASFIAIDAAGNRSRPQSVAFTVVSK